MQRWLEDHKRGRPNVGEIKAVLQDLYPEAAAAKEGSKWEADRRTELLHACSILQNPEPFQSPNYRHTIEYAEKCLKHHKFSSWEAAMEWLEPGWTPPVTVTYL